MKLLKISNLKPSVVLGTLLAVVVVLVVAYYTHFANPLLYLSLILIFLLFGFLTLFVYLRKQDFELDDLRLSRLNLVKIPTTVKKLQDEFRDSKDSDAFLSRLITELKGLVGCDLSALWWLDESSQCLSCRLNTENLPSTLSVDSQKLKTFMDILAKESILTSTDIYQDERLEKLVPFLEKRNIKSFVAASIFQDGQLRGMLICATKTYRRWRLNDTLALIGLSGLAAQFFEVRQRKQAEADLFKLTHYDSITNLPTFNFLMNVFKTLPTNFKTLLLVVRVGGLKDVNDRYGKKVGDCVMAQASDEIKKILKTAHKSVDMVRLSSARLAIILYNADPVWIAQEFASKIDSLNKSVWHIKANGGACFVKLQFGATIFPDDGDNAERLLRNAELALTKVREANTDTYLFYDTSLYNWIDEKANYDLQLRTAFKNKEFKLYYQGQYNKNEKLVGTEVLLRWHNSKRGVIEPGKFIDYAEENNLILEIGDWVMEEAFKFFSKNLKPLSIKLSLNISVMQLKADNFIPRVTQLVEKYEIEPKDIIFEIVESFLMDIEFTTKIKQLHNLGIEVSLDDFGTGYSCLQYLQDFQVEELKLDKAFLKPLFSADDALLVRTIIAMAKELKIRTVAEGVETYKQLEFLKNLNCDIYQGYYFDKPTPQKDFLEKVKKMTF